MNIAHAKRTLAGTAAASVLLITAACGSDTDDVSTEATIEPTTAATTEATAGATEDATEAGDFVAGDYSATGNYQSPGGTESVDVDVTIDADGTITDVAVEGSADGGNSQQFQEQFASGIADVVVGEPIDELSVSRVSGSSLTSNGFNAAIEDIIEQAQV